MNEEILVSCGNFVRLEDYQKIEQKYEKALHDLIKADKENEDLKLQLKATTHCYDEVEHRELKSRIDKAINYILYEKEPVTIDLLEILQGSGEKMTAKEMFEKLGFIKQEDESLGIIRYVKKISCVTSNEYWHIHFHKNERIYQTYKINDLIDKDYSLGILFKWQKAINKQIEELGWNK